MFGASATISEGSGKSQTKVYDGHCCSSLNDNRKATHLFPCRLKVLRRYFPLALQWIEDEYAFRFDCLDY